MTYSIVRFYFKVVSVDLILHIDNLISNVLSNVDLIIIALKLTILLSYSVERFYYTFNKRRFKNAYIDKIISIIISLTEKEHENFYLDIRVLQ